MPDSSHLSAGRPTIAPSLGAGLFAGAVLLTLLVLHHHNYLLFHTAAELGSTVMAGGLFMVAWATRRTCDSGSLHLIGYVYGFVGLIDLIHAMSYTGMELIQTRGGDEATQLWIAARYPEALALAVAPLLSRRAIPSTIPLLLGTLYTGLVLLAIFKWDIFPACFEPDSGLTAFKIGSEYLVCLLMLIAAGGLLWRRADFDRRVLVLLLGGLGLRIASEVLFTFYAGPNDIYNMLGHVAKIFAVGLFAWALFQTTVLDPSRTIYRGLAHTATSLRSERDRLCRILDSMVEPMCIIGTDHRLEYVNAAMIERFGDRSGEVACHSYIHGRDAVCPGCQIEAVCAGATQRRKVVIDGRTYDVIETPIDAADGTVAKLAAYRDMTELHRTLRELRTQRRELARANESLASFTYMASHDMRAPLRLVATYLDLLLETLPEATRADTADYAKRIAQACQRMQQMIDAFLDLSRARRTSLALRPTDLGGIADECIAELRESNPDHFPEITIDHPPTVPADPGMMKLVLGNLLGNAWKFARRTSPARIAFRAEQREGGTVYCVCDNGPGFDPATASELFLPFRRLSTTAAGMGIGLAIVERIVSRHGGEVWAETDPGEGARFCFTIGQPPANQAAGQTTG
ncbi:MAG: MASE3 domain-containing protein [Planctomycetota bacterium]